MSLIGKAFKRFLDDLFFIFFSDTTMLHKVFEEINKIHPFIKFTMKHTTPVINSNPCGCDKVSSVTYLDTSLSIKNSKIEVDLYRKPTDRNQYLLPSSCHPAHVTNNIPFSLAYRIVRICSEPDTRDQRLDELRQLLLDRNYKINIINSAINRAKLIPRMKAIERVSINTEEKARRPVFSVLYDPRLPALPSIVKKHWRTMVASDPHLKEVFPLLSPPP